MPGKIHEMITRLILLRVGENRHLEAAFKIKLIMKGVDPDAYDGNSPDDPAMMQRIHTVAKSMGYDL